MVERDLAKVDVVSSNLITRSIFLPTRPVPATSQSAVEPLYRWSKYVTEDQLDDWETKLIVEDIIFSAEMLVGRERWQLSSFQQSRKRAEQLKEKFGGGVTEIKPETWQPAQPTEAGPVLRIRDQIVVTETAEPDLLDQVKRDNPDRMVLSFPPQLAFGTGAHPTTAGCLRFLADFAALQGDQPWRVLDLGCGSGILAVAAAKLGATDIVAIENDGMALGYAIKNAERHDVSDRITFLEADAIEWLKDKKNGPFDLIAANLFSSLLIELLPSAKNVATKETGIILSGFLTSQAREVTAASKAAGFPLKDFLRRGKWVAGAGKRQG